MRKIKRSSAFEITLTIHDENFIRPPKDAQRNAIINRALKEFVGDLTILNEQAKHFVPGATATPLGENREQKILEAQEIMEDWQFPLMKEMAKTIAQNGGDILEIGFGRGISANMIMKYPVNSYTTIECNDHVVNTYFKDFKSTHNTINVELIHGLWQNNIEALGKFDGILFHTYPLNEDEYMQYVNGSITFAEHFFEHASKHLKEGGAFTYFSNEIDSLSREHQHLILKYFSSYSVHTVNLDMPYDVADTWWANSMVVIKVVK